jgi:hypothetical protein
MIKYTVFACFHGVSQLMIPKRSANNLYRKDWLLSLRVMKILRKAAFKHARKTAYDMYIWGFFVWKIHHWQMRKLGDRCFKKIV